MGRPTACKRRFRVLSALMAFFALAFVFPSVLQAQELPEDAITECQGGLKYILAYPDTTMNTFDARFAPTIADKFQVFVYSAIDNNRVKFGPGNGASSTKTLKAGRFEIIDIKGNAVVTESGVPSFTTFGLEADYPVTVYCYFGTKFGGEAWTPIPVESWGNEYYAAAHPGEVIGDIQPGGEFNYQKTNKAAPAEILIIAAFDDTRVTIYPNGQLDNYPQTVNIDLKAYQAYQVQSYVDTLTSNIGAPQPDLGGSWITSNKPIGVISGLTRGAVIPLDGGLAQNSFKNSSFEWMPPKDQFGTEFVYMPTWDAHRPSGDKLDEKRQAEYIRIHGAAEGYQTLGQHTDGTAGSKIGFKVPIRGRDEGLNFFQLRQGVPVPIHFKTDSSALAMMTSTAVVKFNGTQIYWGSYIGASYQALASPYMVELTPREQWINFAPFYAPSHPNNMNHYINVVTDTASASKVFYKMGNAGAEQQFVMNRGKIPGTDLIWGNMQLVPGNDYYLRGREESSKFYGFVYGEWEGYELYRPGKTKKGDTKSALAGGGDKGGKNVLHPSEYEENISIAYGYPLAPSRCVLAPPDSLEIKTEQNCDVLTIKVRALNDNPVGLKTITLEKGTKNARLNFLNPPRPDLILRAVEAEFEVRPINPAEDAEGTVLITDRTGHKTRIPYRYFAERLDLKRPSPNEIIGAEGIDFGPVTLLDKSADSTIIMCNPLGRDLTIKEIKFVIGTQRFEFAEVPKLPFTLKPGECAEMKVNVTPDIENKLYEDSVVVMTECGKFGVKLRAETVKPCLYVDDLNFGTFDLSDPKALEGRVLPLKICNNGRGTVTFRDPVLNQFDNAHFTLEGSSLEDLKNARLGPNQCITIFVKFTPITDETGSFRTVGRLWANTRDCRDTSVWTAVVTQPGPQILGYDWKERWVVLTNNCGDATPADPSNPKTKSQTDRYEAMVPVWNTGNSEFKIESITIEGADKDFFELDKSGDAAINITPGMSVRPAAAGDTHKIWQKVYFYPKDERAYQAEVVVGTTAGTVRAFLDGIGIEEHVSISGFDFGRHLYTTPGSVVIDGTINICAPKSTKPLEINGLQLRNGDAGEFEIVGPMPPYVLGKDSCLTVNVRFRPSKSGNFTTQIEAIGLHSRCDDSVNTLVGATYVNGVIAAGHDFGAHLTCNEPNGPVTVQNTGESPLVITNATVNDPSGYFQIDFSILPDTIQPGQTITYPVDFTPTSVGDFTATVQFEVMDSTGLVPVTEQPGAVEVKGSAYVVQSTASISRDFIRYPGSKLIVPVTLDDSKINEVGVTTFYFNINWNKGMLKLLSSLPELKGTLLEGWTVKVVDQGSDVYSIQFTAPDGKTLQGPGTLMNLEYLTFLGDTMSSELPFEITLTGKSICASVVTNPGRARIDSVCGLNFRLIEATSSNYALNQNNPNPFNPTTDITFSVGLDGQTTVVVYNAVGEKVATLVSEYLQPGTYTVTWDASAQPSGLYYYRLNSGHWSTTKTMILRK